MEVGTDDTVIGFICEWQDERVRGVVEFIERDDAGTPGGFAKFEPDEGVVDFVGIGSVGGDDVVASGLELDGGDGGPAGSTFEGGGGTGGDGGLGEGSDVAVAEEGDFVAELESIAEGVPDTELGDGDVVGSDLEERADTFSDVGVAVESGGIGLGEDAGLGWVGGEEWG